MSGGEALSVVIAIDPGRHKCGLAAVTLSGQVVALEIVSRREVAARVADLARQRPLAALLVGDRTGSGQVSSELGNLPLGITPQSVPEHHTTLRARERYFADHPPRGLWRLLPRGLLLPPRPIDDYAALVMAEDWLAAHGAG